MGSSLDAWVSRDDWASTWPRADTRVAKPPELIFCGVSGCGKSTIGRRVARELRTPFVEGDDLHVSGNIANMEAGRPLSDNDRLPWLTALSARLGAMAVETGGVMACSALKRVYRTALASASADVYFVLLAIEKEAALERVSHRADHFMPSELVDSQFDQFEPLAPEEPGIVLDALADPDENVKRTLDFIIQLRA
ncbi:AAA family ATPase [Actinospica durhamensis]|uniref:Gluconokinase n=1 Tax=Actinospica durhamensis TaxID=1508375 RepID=A0A941EWB3_9ACTN|nr:MULTISPECIES: gluconokinase, GntK/IdnK-type [Actinospica]MBR7835129.1 AAA family ATPase [Actinospica durhamensis]